MDITRSVTGEIAQLALAGRLDAYWSDHLNAMLADVLREGHHHIRVDCAQVTFLSSAGIGVLMRFYKELAGIGGTFRIVDASRSVASVLELAKLSQFLLEPPVAAPNAAAPSAIPHRHVDRDAASFDVFEVNPGAALTIQSIGTDALLASGAFGAEHCTSLGSVNPTIAVGVGAFGDSFDDCRQRFGELLSVAGATVYQPADGTNVADYLVSTGDMRADVRVLYCLALNGGFSHLVRFETTNPAGMIGLSQLVADSLDVIGYTTAGVAIVAEAAGLVGAALRQSPATPYSDSDFYAHPGIRTRISFSAERTFARSVALAGGIVTRMKAAGQLRPIGHNVAGHVHAAAFRFRPVRKGVIDLAETVSALFQPEQVMGVLHLLTDDRGAGAVGESEFVRGACWVGPIATPADS